jgi:hypothetical protein
MINIKRYCSFDQHLVYVRQEHFFSESDGQKGYIQERLKRVRRSLAPENQQRPRNKSSNEVACKQTDGEKLN